MTLFRSFILVSVKLLAALGLHAENLMTLVDLVTSIEDALPTSSLLRVPSTAIPPSLHESLEHFSSSIKAWVVSFSSVPVGHLVLEASRVHAALKAINKDRRLDFSQFGLPSSSLLASVSSAAPRQELSSSLQPLTSALKRKARDYRNSESHPGQGEEQGRALPGPGPDPARLFPAFTRTGPGPGQLKNAPGPARVAGFYCQNSRAGPG